MTAITMAPMAYRPIVRVIRSSSISIRDESRGNRTLWSERERFGRSMTRNSVMNDDRHRAEPEPEDLAAELERVAELRREVGCERLGPRLELVAEIGPAVDLPEELRGADPLDDVRQVLDQVADGPDERAHEEVPEQAQHDGQARARPSSPRCLASSRAAPRARSTGVVSTIARKRAMKIQRTACRAAMNAQTTAIVPRIVTIVRVEIVISTRFGWRLGSCHAASLRTRVGGTRRGALANGHRRSARCGRRR